MGRMIVTLFIMLFVSLPATSPVEAQISPTDTPSATSTATSTPTPPPTPTPTSVGSHVLGGIVCRGPYDPNFCGYLYAFPIVTLQPLGWQVPTGYHGNFQFDGVPDGQYTLELSPSCLTDAVGGLSCYAPLPTSLNGADAWVTWKPLAPTPTPTPAPPSVGGIAEQPDVTARRSATASSDREYTVYFFGGTVAFIVLAAAGAAGWRRRRA